VAGEDDSLVAPYPHVMMSVLDLSAEYPDRLDTASESEFNMWSKSKRQRWIRKLKRYVACLRSAHHVEEHSNPDRLPEAAEDDYDSTYEEEDDMAEASNVEAMDQDAAEAPAANADGQGIDAQAEENATAAETSDSGMGVHD
jgi:hypothetical protein